VKYIHVSFTDSSTSPRLKRRGFGRNDKKKGGWLYFNPTRFSFKKQKEKGRATLPLKKIKQLIFE